MINITPNQINPATGAYAMGENVNVPVLAILMDYEAAGITQVHEWSATTPFNPAGGYTNVFYHMDLRGWNDNTEKAIVLCLD